MKYINLLLIDQEAPAQGTKKKKNTQIKKIYIVAWIEKLNMHFEF